MPRMTIDSTYRTAMEWALVAPEEKRGKFFLSCVEDERLLTEMRDLVEYAVEDGLSESEFIHQARQMLSELENPATGRPYNDPEFWRNLTPEEAAEVDKDVEVLNSRARLRLIYRTQYQLADGMRTWMESTDPDFYELFPGWRFVRQPGAKTKRPDHVAHEGDVRLISDVDYWLARNSPDQGGFNQPFPPFGYNSWMRVFPVSRDECERLGLLKPGKAVPPMPAESARYGLQQLVQDASTTSVQDLSTEARQSVSEACQELGIGLRVTKVGTSDVAPKPLLDPQADADLLAELAEIERTMKDIGEDEL